VDCNYIATTLQILCS